MTADQPARQPGRGDVNVLVTAAGRRTGLVEAFGNAAHERGGRVYAADVDGLAPALYLADEAIRSLRTDDVAVRRRSPRLGRAPRDPTGRPDHRHGPADPRRARRTFRGSRLPRGRSRRRRSSRRPWTSTLSGLAFEARGDPRAAIVDPADCRRPRTLPSQVFVKPRAGSASQDTYRIELANSTGPAARPRTRSSRRCSTGPEITIDALLDLDGRPIHYVPRRRIRTLGGESIQGVTLEHDTGVRNLDRGRAGPLLRDGRPRPADAAGIHRHGRPGAVGDQRPVRRRVPAGTRSRRRLSRLAARHDRRGAVRPRCASTSAAST